MLASRCRRAMLVALISGVLSAGHPGDTLAGGMGKSLASATAKRLLKQDLRNHASAPVKRLSTPRTVHRYTSRTRAKQEAAKGLRPNTHMTGRARPGRPPSPESARRRYGLPRTPQVRETIRLPRGFPVRENPVAGGARSAREVTSPWRVPPKAIQRMTPLRPRQ